MSPPMALAGVAALVLATVGAAPVSRRESVRPAAVLGVAGSAEPSAGPSADPGWRRRPARPVLLPSRPGTPPSPTGLARALATGATVPGSAVAGIVLDADGGTRYAVRADDPLPPASTLKIATAVAALRALGPGDRLATRVVRTGSTVVLVGGGDPTLALRPRRTPGPPGGSLEALAAATARGLTTAGVRTVSVRYDASRYVGPATAGGWKPGYLSDGHVARVSALMVDGGRVRADRRARVRDPALAAARAFAARLPAYGVRVSGLPRPAPAPAGAVTLAQARSAPIPDLVEEMLTTSDNNLAEALAREVAGRYGLPRSFAGATEGVRRGVAAAGVDPGGLVVADGSGLSTRNRARPSTVVALLLAALRQPELRPVLAGLPVAGFTGTLAERFHAGAPARAAGGVRAKTGTLSGVSTLAGLVRDRDGALLLFAFAAIGGASTSRAQTALDRLATTLAGCGCR